MNKLSNISSLGLEACMPSTISNLCLNLEDDAGGSEVGDRGVERGGAVGADGRDGEERHSGSGDKFSTSPEHASRVAIHSTGEKADEEKLTAGAPPSPRPLPSPAVTSRARTPLSWIRSWTLEVRIDSGVERAGMTRFHSGNDDSGPDPILNRVTLFRPD